MILLWRCHDTLIPLSQQCYYTVVTVVGHCCDRGMRLSWQCHYTVTALSQQWCDTAVTQVWECHDTVAALSQQCHSSIVTMLTTKKHMNTRCKSESKLATANIKNQFSVKSVTMYRTWQTLTRMIYSFNFMLKVHHPEPISVLKVNFIFMAKEMFYWRSNVWYFINGISTTVYLLPLNPRKWIYISVYIINQIRDMTPVWKAPTHNKRHKWQHLNC